jgi:hypothetical protein
MFQMLSLCLKVNICLEVISDNNKLYFDGERGLPREGQPEEGEAGGGGVEQDIEGAQVGRIARPSQQDQGAIEETIKEQIVHGGRRLQL